MSLLLGIQIGKRASAFSCPLTLSRTCFLQPLALGWRRRWRPRVGPPEFSAFTVVKGSHTLHPIPISFHSRLTRSGSGYVNTCLNYFKKILYSLGKDWLSKLFPCFTLRNIFLDVQNWAVLFFFAFLILSQANRCLLWQKKREVAQKGSTKKHIVVQQIFSPVWCLWLGMFKGPSSPRLRESVKSVVSILSM